MNKKQAVYFLLFISANIGSWGLIVFGLPQGSIRPSFPVGNLHIFAVVSSLSIVLALNLLSKKDRFKDQLGFLYLGSVIIKPIVLVLVFHTLFFDDFTFTNMEALILLFPLVLGLIFEVILCAQILKRLNSKKKTIKG